MESRKDVLKSYIGTNLMGVIPEEVDEVASLFKEKRLDSINLVELITFVEKQWKISVSPLEITFENFDSIELLDQYIASKISK